MGNIDRYHEAWKEHRATVRALKSAYESRMKAISRYEGSSGYQEDARAAEKTFEAGLEAARNKSRGKFASVIAAMSGKLEEPSMVAPSEEHLRILEALRMRKNIGANEIQSACAAMGDNDLALGALSDILKGHGLLIPASFKSVSQQKRHAVGELERAADMLMKWDGRSRAQVMEDAANASRAYRFGGSQVPPSEHRRDSAYVADIEAGAGSYDTMKAIIPEVSFDAVMKLD